MSSLWQPQFTWKSRRSEWRAGWVSRSWAYLSLIVARLCRNMESPRCPPPPNLYIVTTSVIVCFWSSHPLGVTQGTSSQEILVDKLKAHPMSCPKHNNCISASRPENWLKICITLLGPLHPRSTITVLITKAPPTEVPRTIFRQESFVSLDCSNTRVMPTQLLL